MFSFGALLSSAEPLPIVASVDKRDSLCAELGVFATAYRVPESINQAAMLPNEVLKPMKSVGMSLVP
jgi:hypothetical protein